MEGREHAGDEAARAIRELTLAMEAALKVLEMIRREVDAPAEFKDGAPSDYRDRLHDVDDQPVTDDPIAAHDRNMAWFNR